jgi:response regulator NasT
VDNDLVCLPMPARAGDLVQTVAMMQNAVEIRIKKRKSRPKARSKEDMEVLSAAKALIMARNNMTEPEAHRYIQKTAMDTGTSLVETAQMVLDLFSL